MSTSRRGILGMFAAAPAIAPELGKSLAGDSLYEITKMQADKAQGNASLPSRASWTNSYLAKRLERLHKRGVRPVLASDMQHPVLDIDLHTNRSMSLAAKYSIMRQRIGARSYEQEYTALMRDALGIADAPAWVRESAKPLGLKPWGSEDD